MNWVTTALRELFSLFVDDIRFTIAILIWLAIATLGLPHSPIPEGWQGAVLLLGCAVILIFSAWQAAKSFSRRAH